MSNLFENLQMMRENNDVFEIGKNIPVIVALGGGNIDNLKFTIDQMSDNEVEKLNALLSDLSKYKLDGKDIIMVDKGNVNGENQKYYKTINAALDDAVLLKKHNTELGKSALYNYNGKTFLRTYNNEYGIDVYNLPKELFNELIKNESSNLKESNNEFIVKLSCMYMDDYEIKERTHDAKKYNVNVKYDIASDYDSYITISGSPENVKNYINNEYARFEDVVSDYEDELRNAYSKYNPNASEDEINDFLSI